MRIQIISSVESDGYNSKCDFNGEKLEADFFLLYILFYNTSYLCHYDLHKYNINKIYLSMAIV